MTNGNIPTGDILDASVSCVESCDAVADGDYMSCLGCDVYLTCTNEIMIDNRTCPLQLIWNDSRKRCDYRRNGGCPC